MRKNASKPETFRTEAKIHLAASPPIEMSVRSAEELLHELQVQQIELEMQNEQLRQSQVELEKSHDRYVNFYDFAPVGYITLTHSGMIDEINLTGARMLGVERSKLPYLRFANFVATEDRDRWHHYFFDVLKRDHTVACELTLQHDGGTCFYARLDGLCLKNDGKESVVRIVLTDAQLEKNHRQALNELECQKFALDQHSIVAITDVSGKIIYANDKFCKISRYSRDELLGQNHRMINSGTHSKAFFQDMYRTISAGKVWHGDICNRAKDGSLYWVETTIVPNMQNDGKPFQYVAIRTDITVRILAEEALKKSEENFRSLFEYMFDGSAHCRMLFERDVPLDFIYLDVNNVFGKVTGLGEVTGKKASEVLPDIRESNPELFQSYGRVALTGQPEQFDTYLVTRGIWVSVSVYSPGREHFVAILKNITRRKEAEVFMQYYKQVIETTIDGFLTTDTQGNLLDANEAFAKMLGYTSDELLKMHINQLDAIDQTAEAAARRAKIIAQGHDRFETRYHHKDGHLIDVEVSATFMPEAQKFFVFSHDITERNRIKQELIVLNDQLTHEVTKRTADLSALTAHVQNVAELERANLARELHDELGSTLVGINMEVRRLSGKIASPDILQDLSLIKKLLLNANEIKQNVINQLYPTVLDTFGFVAAIEWLVIEYRMHSGLTVELVMPDEEIVMEHAFSLAAYRITQECLTNIAKHAEASKVHIEVKTSDGFLDMTIQDNGIGFSGGINIGGINKGGHGIFGMIERARYLGGSLEFGKGKKHGTITHLILPIAAPKPVNRKRVLVVDDHAIVRNAIRQLLNDQTDDFFVAGEAADGNAAIQMATEGEWDIMLLDISLPKTNGLKVLEAVLAIKPGMPIIMLSGLEKRKYSKIALSKGAKCYIEKSETDNLVEAMRSATIGR